MLNEKQLEVAARELCRLKGFDPERWRHMMYALKAHDQMDEAIRFAKPGRAQAFSADRTKLYVEDDDGKIRCFDVSDWTAPVEVPIPSQVQQADETPTDAQPGPMWLADTPISDAAMTLSEPHGYAMVPYHVAQELERKLAAEHQLRYAAEARVSDSNDPMLVETCKELTEALNRYIHSLKRVK